MNIALLKDELNKINMKHKDYANYLGINPATLYRKMQGISDFTREEVELSRKLFGTKSTDRIFFA